MTDGLDAHTLQADPADDLMARLSDARAALVALADAARSVMCPGCDPTGEVTEQVRRDLEARFDVTEMDADLLLGLCADTRGVLLGVLEPPCDHDEEGP